MSAAVQDEKTGDAEEKRYDEEKGYDFGSGWVNDIEDPTYVKNHTLILKLLKDFEINPVGIHEKLMKEVERYTIQPELLDGKLGEYTALILIPIKKSLDDRDEKSMVDETSALNCAFKLLWRIITIRGYKALLKHLPHDVVDLEPVLNYLLALPKGSTVFYTRYCLLIWLSIIVLIPFDLKTVDSQASVGGGIVERILSASSEQLRKTTKNSEGAAVLISRLFSRPDIQATHLKKFILWAVTTIDNDLKNEEMFAVVGVLKCLSEILKHVARSVLLSVIPILLPLVESMWEDEKNMNSSMLKKLTCKLSQRIGLVYLKPVVASWRYKKARKAFMGGGTLISSSANTIGGKQTDVDEDDIPEEVDPIIDYLLKCLVDPDTIVRWSAAKGVGRIVMRLSQDYADQVVSNVMELLDDINGHNSWHGGCLCLAELARRGLLLPFRLEEVVPLVGKALHYDVFRGTHSVGDYVRDSACYVAWAFARAYEPLVMKPYVSVLAEGLLTMAVFDREIFCRRAACAAFQENVGRQGNFPHGIDINTAADYFTVGNMTNAFLRVSLEVAKYPAYQKPFVTYLTEDRLSHWDKKIRELSARSLAEMVTLNPELFQSYVIPHLLPKTLSLEFFPRHGALFGIAKVLLALNKNGVKLEEALKKPIINIIPKLEKARLYRGRGGLDVRFAVTVLLEAMPFSELDMSARAVARHQLSINENIYKPHDHLQEQAAKALRAFGDRYYNEIYTSTKDYTTWNRLTVTDYFLKLDDMNPANRRGAALGLACLPASLLRPRAQEIVDKLISKSLIEVERERRDDKTRTYCVRALGWFIKVAGTTGYKYEYKENERTPTTQEAEKEEEVDDAELKLLDDMSEDEKEVIPETFTWAYPKTEDDGLVFDRIFSAIILRMQDYSANDQGDIGSFAREQGMGALLDCCLTLDSAGKQPNGQPWLRPIMGILTVKVILKQMGEKLDRLRVASGKTLLKLLNSQLEVPHKKELQKIFSQTLQINNTSWYLAEKVMPLLEHVMHIPIYRQHALWGLMRSCGGLTDNLRNIALIPIKAYTNSLKVEEFPDFGAEILDVFSNPHVPDKFRPEHSIKCIACFLGQGIFDRFIGKQSKFVERLLVVLKALLDNTWRQVNMYLASIGAIVGILRFGGDGNEACGRLMFRLLTCEYPIVRRRAALSLYESLLAHEEFEDIYGEDKVETLSDHLLTIPWGKRVNGIPEIQELESILLKHDDLALDD